ncbi:oxidoreductase [Saccharopolyspora phatthalungensis]|uniref:2,4-dienoyl-CoA reductase (NADPH2) n=1 Tax=Saccharopolyspora phatthalungensis TaxID=664693 RepID=A0A840QEQ1_9PSEU|nr:NADH:flavin oxidoreductase [Saccharopolyspora phatthalungensis]MBB5156965.1 2,4-dienoyl-CoA reductase (NADPH2) [Saccharopolyspora phatthalungensis]
MTAPTTTGKLFSSLRIGSREARNRVVFAPMSVCYGDEAGQVSDAEVEHYARRARGGAGIVVTENFAISTAGRQMPRQTLVAGEEHLPGLARLASAITAHGALAIVQIVHAGRYAGPWDVYDQARRLAPSAVPFELTPGRIETPAEITDEEIRRSIAEFGRAAELCQRAGFDGVDIHGAQGFLISGFLSPLTNRRTDRWGGSFDNRARFALEVVREVRRRTRPDFLVGMHLISDELVDGGWSIDDAVRLAPLLEDEGVQFLFAIPATFETLRLPANQGLFARRGYGGSASSALAAAVSIPVIANGGLGDPSDAEEVLEHDNVAAVGLARALFADPDWPRKVAAGQPVRHCACSPPICARTQLTGAVCAAWPAPAAERGYFGLDD